MKLQSALDMAARGFKVFPLVANTKLPRKDFPWKQNATTDEATIRGWWGEDPDYNIGVATGFGTLVVDADTKDGKPGLDSLALLDMLGLPGSLRVDTPSGGVHVYLKTERQHANRVDSIADYPGIDLRGENGYVLAPGSTIDGAAYSAADIDIPISKAPAWFEDVLQRSARDHKMSASEQPLVELDRPENIAGAVEYLTARAPEAVEGAGGDQTTYEVACRVRDYGVSEATALELMLEHWNEAKASPPWMPDDLQKKVGNAFAYATGAWGGQTAAGEFGVVDIDIGEGPARPSDAHGEFLEPAKKDDPAPFPIVAASGVTTGHLPPRQWLYGYMLSRKYVSTVASPGGVGKTAFTFGVAVSCAIGETLLHDRPHKPLKVWLYNLEDDMIELQRRIQAVARHYDIPQSALDNIVLTSGRDRPLTLARQGKDGGTVATADARLLAETIKANGIDILVLDPLVNAHAVPENDNDATAKLMRILAKVADEADCGILIVHHTRKGFVAGEADSIRGGSPIVANSRGAYTLAAMNADEAKTFGVPEDDRKRYVRLDDAKANMSISSGKGRWFHLQSVSLGNGDEEYPTGDSVQVVVRWSPPEAMDGLGKGDIRRMLEAIDEGPGDGERYAAKNSGRSNDRWAGTLLIERFGRSPEQAKGFIAEALKRQWLVETEYVSPSQRRSRKCVEVCLANAPEGEIEDFE